ncbi:MAG: hypothetical protein ISS23_00540 [Nanoarchaeota archaeon]|nr:hypothetical protein [Nanoarchaeota archaeon]
MVKMKKLLIFFITIILLSHFVQGQNPETYYRVNLEYDKGEISITSVEIEIFPGEIENLPGGFVAEIIDFDKNILTTTFFDIPLEILYDSFDPETKYAVSGGKIELEQAEVELFIPHYTNAKEIIIYNKEYEEVTRKSISEYSKNRCGDLTCQASESYRTCKEDCPSSSKDNYCDGIKDGKCDPDCTKKTDTDCKEVKAEKKDITEKVTENWEIILITSIILIIILFFLLKKRK